MIWIMKIIMRPSHKPVPPLPSPHRHKAHQARSQPCLCTPLLIALQPPAPSGGPEIVIARASLSPYPLPFRASTPSSSLLTPQGNGAAFPLPGRGLDPAAAARVLLTAASRP